MKGIKTDARDVDYPIIFRREEKILVLYIYLGLERSSTLIIIKHTCKVNAIVLNPLFSH